MYRSRHSISVGWQNMFETLPGRPEPPYRGRLLRQRCITLLCTALGQMVTSQPANIPLRSKPNISSSRLFQSFRV